MTTTIVLDLDDTLYLEEGYIQSGLAAVGEWADASLGTHGFRETACSLRRQGVTTRLFDATLAALGVTPEPALIDQCVIRYRAHLPDIALEPDALAFLQLPCDWSMALITDGAAESQRRKIDALGLRRFNIDPIICTDDWGRCFWKPHRRAFEVVHASRKGTATGFLYVADNPAKDFITPARLGWSTVQINRPGAIHPRVPPSPHHAADAEIASLEALTPGLVEDLLAVRRRRWA
nr:HAD family hydrolase [uncultured Sphingomonas sp.]